MSNSAPTNPEPPKSAAHAAEPHLEHFHRHIKQAIGVFVALLVLTVVTVGASYIQLGHSGNIILAMIIATFKAALVVAVFMHLIAEKMTIFRFLILTLIFFAGLMFLTLGAFDNAVGIDRVP